MTQIFLRHLLYIKAFIFHNNPMSRCYYSHPHIIDEVTEAPRGNWLKLA